jgi:histidine ammonia-lyase
LKVYEDARKRGERAVEPQQPDAYYGINTGFGALAGKASLGTVYETKALSRNLIASHNTGVGEYFDEETVRAAMLLRANSLALGYSGVRQELVEKLIVMLNAGIYPAVPLKGSLGASGDLAPLSHLALAVTTVPRRPAVQPTGARPLDETDGEVFVQARPDDLDARTNRGQTFHITTQHDSGQQTVWRRVRACDALREVGIEQIPLRAKEGLAFSNGATFSAAVAALRLYDARNLLRNAELALAMSLEGMRGFRDAFLPQIHAVRGHKGAIEVAEHVMQYVTGTSDDGSLLDQGSDVCDPNRKPPQDPYSVRCAPQVLGMVCDTLDFITGIVETEINAVTDNPLIFNDPARAYVERKCKAVSGGNFHGEPIAMAMDFLKVAIAELGNIAERRIFQLTILSIEPHDEKQYGVSGFLIAEPLGKEVSSGFMIAQYTAASLVSDCKTLAHPDSVDSIPSSANKEDHVSMSLNAARHAGEIVDNIEAVIAIEFLCAAQAIDLQLDLNMGLQPAKTKAERLSPDRLQYLGVGTRAAYTLIRDRYGIDYLEHDRVLSGDIRTLIQAVHSGELVDAADAVIHAGV